MNLRLKSISINHQKSNLFSENHEVSLYTDEEYPDTIHLNSFRPFSRLKIIAAKIQFVMFDNVTQTTITGFVHKTGSNGFDLIRIELE